MIEPFTDGQTENNIMDHSEAVIWKDKVNSSCMEEMDTMKVCFLET